MDWRRDWERIKLRSHQCWCEVVKSINQSLNVSIFQWEASRGAATATAAPRSMRRTPPARPPPLPLYTVRLSAALVRRPHYMARRGRRRAPTTATITHTFCWRHIGNLNLFSLAAPDSLVRLARTPWKARTKLRAEASSWILSVNLNSLFFFKLSDPWDLMSFSSLNP